MPAQATMLVAAPEPVFVLAMGQLCPARGSHQAQRDIKASGGAALGGRNAERS
jgi:hypothetical protein